MHTEFISPTLANTSIRIFNGQKNASVNSQCNWHMHDEVEILMLKEGEKEYCVGNKTYRFSKGDIIFVNSQVPHKTFTPKGSCSLLLQFGINVNLSDIVKKDYVFHFINHLKNDVVLFKKGTDINTQLCECIYNIIAEDNSHKNSYDTFIMADVYKILAILYRNNIISNPEKFFSMQNIEKITPALTYIDKNFADNITLDDMSKMLNIDKSHFCRIFKKAVNTSFVQYLNFVRICHAEKLLITTNKSVSEISCEVGFASVAYFTKTFKKYKGCTPSLYKKVRMINE